MRRSSLGDPVRSGADFRVISLSAFGSTVSLLTVGLLATPTAASYPIGWDTDCLQKSLAAHIFFTDKLTRKTREVPFKDPYLLKLMYGQQLSECHAEHMLSERGITRSVVEEVEERSWKNEFDRAVHLETDLYAQVGDVEVVFAMSSACVPEAIRTNCLGKIVPE